MPTSIRSERQHTPRAISSSLLRRLLIGAAGVGLSALMPSLVLAQAGPPLKLGALMDMTGVYADTSGPGSEVAAQMAIEDFGGEVLGRKIQAVFVDHLNKPDLASSQAREMFDNQGVEAIIDFAGSATGLAIIEVAKARNKIVIVNGAGSMRFTNEACTPYTVHYTWDTFSQANVTGLATVRKGLDSWFFLAVDYAFGQELERDTAAVVQKTGGKVLGSVKHPLNTSDFSSFLLQAQSSGAKVIGLANAGNDSITAIKQATEFGLTRNGRQRLSTLLSFITDIDSVGLDLGQGLLLTESWYWDLNDETRAFAKRFRARTQRAPTSVQAGLYSSLTHYLNAVKAVGTTESAAVMAKMKQTPINDMYARNGRIREDGRMLHDMYLFEVKTPAESRERWDYYKLVDTVSGEQAFQPLESSRCPLLKK